MPDIEADEDRILEDRIEAMGRAQFDPYLKEKIIGVLISEGAKDLSDAELDRCLERCAAAWLPRMAKMYRDCDFLAAAEVFASQKESKGTIPNLLKGRQMNIKFF